ncbi:MAG: DinB family protein [Anaerolineales bacterium]|nr:DinB family protein [Anaerolineales bacterium]
MSEIAELAEKLKIEGERMYAFFADLTDDQWDKEVYTEGTTWSIRNVLSHYVTSERGLVQLFERIRATGEGAADDFSIDRYNASQQEKTKDLLPADLLEQYKQVRAESIRWVGGLKDEELDIQGRHPFLGETVIREMVKMLYLHNQLHYRDVKRALK